jgi:hypothetical protein
MLRAFVPTIVAVACLAANSAAQAQPRDASEAIMRGRVLGSVAAAIAHVTSRYTIDNDERQALLQLAVRLPLVREHAAQVDAAASRAFNTAQQDVLGMVDRIQSPGMVALACGESLHFLDGKVGAVTRWYRETPQGRAVSGR